jgi:hypothetical protein
MCTRTHMSRSLHCAITHEQTCVLNNTQAQAQICTTQAGTHDFAMACGCFSAWCDIRTGTCICVHMSIHMQVNYSWEMKTRLNARMCMSVMGSDPCVYACKFGMLRDVVQDCRCLKILSRECKYPFARWHAVWITRVAVTDACAKACDAPWSTAILRNAKQP